MLLNKQKINRAVDKPLLDHERAMSWSMVSSYKFNKEQWWFKYVYHGKCTKEFCNVKQAVYAFCPLVKTSPEMEFGKEVGGKLEKDPTYMPEVLREGVMEYKLEARWKGIKLIGYADSLHDREFILNEFKTGRNAWTQKKVNDHGQLTMYALIFYIIQTQSPDWIMRLWWLKTKLDDEGNVRFVENMEPQVFYTTRTFTQCLEFADYLVKLHAEMTLYAENHAPPVLVPEDY